MQFKTASEVKAFIKSKGFDMSKIKSVKRHTNSFTGRLEFYVSISGITATAFGVGDGKKEFYGEGAGLASKLHNTFIDCNASVGA